MKFKLIVLLFYFLPILTIPVEAQLNTDSLKKQLKTANQADKLEIYKHLSNEYLSVSPKESIKFDKKAIEILEKKNKQKEISDILNNIGLNYYNLGEYDNALEYFKKSLEKKKEFGDSKQIAKALNNIGVVYKTFGDYLKSIEYLKRSLAIKKDINDSLGAAQTMTNIGVIYKDIGDFKSSLECTMEALEIYEDLQYMSGIASAYNNIGIAFEGLGDIDVALDYYYNSLKIKEELNDKKGTGNTYNNIGNIFLEKKNYTRALEYFLMSLRIRNEINDIYGIASALDNVGLVYIKSKDYDKAVEFLKRSLKISLDKNLLELQKRNYENLAIAYSKLNDPVTSIIYYKSLINVKDSIFTRDVAKQISEYRIKYSSVEKERQNILLQKNSESKEAGIRLYRHIIGIILLFAISIFFIIAMKNRSKRKVLNSLNKKDAEVINKNKEITNTLAVLENVESQNQAIYEAIPDIMFVTDKTGKFIDYKAPKIDDLYVPPEQFIGKNFSKVLPKNVSDKFLNAIKAISELNKLQSFEYELAISGETKIFEARITKTENDNYLAIVRNVTQARKKDIELRNAKAVAVESLKSKSLVMASLGHEIRTPLSSIIGITSILEETELTEEQEEYLNVIVTSGDNLLYLINNILDFSKLESGMIKIVKNEFNLQESIKEVLKMLEHKVVGTDVDLSYEISKTIPRLLMGDKMRLNQILINLVNNAIKFTKKGHVKIDVEKFDQDAESIRIKFSVIDTGEGISFEERDRLFRDFSQANDDITRKYGGTGLGLSICKQLVNMMDGEIGLESTRGKGSNFWFTIVFDRKDDFDTKTLISKRKPKEIIDEKDVLSVLLIEDNILNQKFATAILKKVGHKVDIADNGKIGVELYKKKKYDIILMDIQMPVMDGIDATKNIRKYEKDNNLKRIKIVAVTAYAMEGDQKRFLSAGIDDYLAKPYKATDLLALLDNLKT